jgi:hypothetical protein
MVEKLKYGFRAVRNGTNSIPSFIHVCPVVLELSHSDRQMDGQTDMTSLYAFISYTSCKERLKSQSNTLGLQQPRYAALPKSRDVLTKMPKRPKFQGSTQKKRSTLPKDRGTFCKALIMAANKGPIPQSFHLKFHSTHQRATSSGKQRRAADSVSQQREGEKTTLPRLPCDKNGTREIKEKVAQDTQRSPLT